MKKITTTVAAAVGGVVFGVACGTSAAVLSQPRDDNFVQTGSVGYHEMTLYGYTCIEAIGGDGSQYDSSKNDYNGNAYNPKGISVWCDPTSKKAK